MIIALLSDMARASGWWSGSVDRGRSGFALGLVDLLAGLLVLLVLGRRQVAVVRARGPRRSAPSRRVDFAGRSTRVTRWRSSSSVMSRLRSSSTMASAGASKMMMWYEPSRWRSIG